MAVSNAKYYPDVASGSVFIGSTAAAGTAFPISTGTAVTFGLWNTSAQKDAVLLGLNVGFTSGTIALGEIGISTQYCGFAIGTAAPLSAFNAGTPKNALVGSGKASSMQFTPAATTTLTTGGTATWWSGVSFQAATAANTMGCTIDINGALIIKPGNLAFVCGSVAQTGLFTMSLIWSEVPSGTN